MNLLRLVTNLLHEFDGFFLNIFISFLTPVKRVAVHLASNDNDLFSIQSESQRNLLFGLTFLGDTSIVFISLDETQEDGKIGLGGTGNHVLNEVSVTRASIILFFP
jgi:hypothetical protein